MKSIVKNPAVPAKYSEPVLVSPEQPASFDLMGLTRESFTINV